MSQKLSRYSFSGHESFQCKSLWLKKGYDFLAAGNSFTDVDAVVKLGVGKNMVASIRHWLRAFGLTRGDELLPVSHYLFSSDGGKDPYVEDWNTLWLLHFLLVHTEIASIYRLLFVEFQKEKKEFSRNEIMLYIKRKCSVPEQRNVYNENTVKKDIGVLLKNYVFPEDINKIEDFSSLMLNLELLSHRADGMYYFRNKDIHSVNDEIFLFSLLQMKGEENTVSFDVLQNLSLIFCLSTVAMIDKIRKLVHKYPSLLAFTDTNGIKNVHFLREISGEEVLNNYYK